MQEEEEKTVWKRFVHIKIVILLYYDRILHRQNNKKETIYILQKWRDKRIWLVTVRFTLEYFDFCWIQYYKISCNQWKRRRRKTVSIRHLCERRIFYWIGSYVLTIDNNKEPRTMFRHLFFSIIQYSLKRNKILSFDWNIFYRTSHVLIFFIFDGYQNAYYGTQKKTKHFL